ncbi:porphobilinogen synthase [Dehalogenimonas formicexedens]|uniref:Delta-aminolevulinic acid dehydratase n=1 Tax=Dehalogenimonas formicexedens TaxID=1839801 RepID=A0A1P8F9I2_9CHLR|nr:porphobilinogen synthase [Dehalogenimonas formicexedens]APV45103.1 porphobilinogen synthase [Dehalogenimonas formicexedens]
MSTFPELRLRRLRRTPGMRKLFRETELNAGDFIYPLFVVDGDGAAQPIPSMPGEVRHTLASLVEEIDDIVRLGIGAVILFGIPAAKDEQGLSGLDPDGIVPRAVSLIKRQVPQLTVITDVCLCEYTSHGHCGVVTNGEVDNDATLPLLGRMAVVHAKAGADIVAPSDMMDGRVGAIRQALDAANYKHIPIMAYSAKYASAFYGPFREAACSAPGFGDRRGYQMDPANALEAMREISADLDEGADAVMVKPALAYLDIVRQAKDGFDCPVVAYNVSGEYSMVKAMAERGWGEEKRLALEILTSIKRAGADVIITYHAKDAARWISEGDR